VAGSDAAGSDASNGGSARGDSATVHPTAGGGPSTSTSTSAGSAARPTAPTGRTTGDLQVRVEWPDVPAAVRSSPGRTACGTPRVPAVSPTTTWGIPDALVIVEGAPPSVPSSEAHLVIADCATIPRLVVGTSLTVTSAVDHPIKLALRKRAGDGALAHLADGAPLALQLPIAGHTVTTRLEPGAIYTLELDDGATVAAAGRDLAFVVAVPSARVTEPSGQTLLHDLPVGRHAVTAWLPPRAGQPAHLAHATATVAGGELAELTISLAP
jgi:hypothetical protein